MNLIAFLRFQIHFVCAYFEELLLRIAFNYVIQSNTIIKCLKKYTLLN